MNFTVDGVEYIIGSSLFPLRDILTVKCFTFANTESFIHDDISKIIDINDFEIGHCYTNSEKIRLISDNFGVEAVYYAGWVFLRNELPIHHAWCVIDGRHVIDMGFSDRDFRFQEKLKYDPNFRERYAENVAYRRANIRRSKDCVMGKVPESILYVGCPDDIESARKLYRDTIKRHPNHVSYAFKGMNAFGASTIQTMLKDMQ